MESDESARQVAEAIEAFYNAMTREFASALTVALRRLRRRPRNCDVNHIVAAIHAANDGFVLRHKLQADALSVEMVVNAEWSIVLGMTEPGLLDPPGGQDQHLQRRLIEASLEIFESGNTPTMDDVAARCDVPQSAVTACFPTVSDLAQRSMDYVIGSYDEIRAIAVSVRGAELAGVENMLIAISELATTTPLLTEMVQSDNIGGFIPEVQRLIADGLWMSMKQTVEKSTCAAAASMMVGAAFLGQRGISIWQSGLRSYMTPTVCAPP